MLIAFTSLPGFVTIVFRGMPAVWRGRHRLIFCWLIFLQAVYPGRKTLEEMARWTPPTITAWRFGRVLKAAYWNVHLLVSWLAQDLLATLPPPAHGVRYLFGDGSHADKRGTKNPVAQKGRISQHHPWFFGLRFVLLMAAWDDYRLPVGFRLILPKRHAGYRSEHALFRERWAPLCPRVGPSWSSWAGMLPRVLRPTWPWSKPVTRPIPHAAGALSWRSPGPGRPLRSNRSKTS